jgi:NADH-quinone oxidoreductase subunit G
MPTVIVDGKEVELAPGERLNGIQAAARAGVEVPHYCWHPGLSVVASCRMCLVETGKKDPATGKIQMMGKLVPACQTPATDGTVFVTDNDNVKNARAMGEEDLLCGTRWIARSATKRASAPCKTITSSTVARNAARISSLSTAAAAR